MKLTKLLILMLITLAPVPGAQVVGSTTQPSDGTSKLHLRAMEEFSRGNYAQALPMLQKVAVALKDQPDRLGPILESIRVCEKNLGSSAGLSPPTGADRKPHDAPKAGEVREMDIKDLGNFDYDADAGGNVPDDVTRLSGSTVRLVGFMIPMDQAENITQFALVPSLFACCFGQPPQIQHTIVVQTPKGKSVSYYPDEIVVEGKLTVEEKKEDGFIVSLFELECDSVKPAAR